MGRVALGLIVFCLFSSFGFAGPKAKMKVVIAIDSQDYQQYGALYDKFCQDVRKKTSQLWGTGQVAILPVPVDLAYSPATLKGILNKYDAQLSLWLAPERDGAATKGSGKDNQFALYAYCGGQNRYLSTFIVDLFRASGVQVPSHSSVETLEVVGQPTKFDDFTAFLVALSSLDLSGQTAGGSSFPDEKVLLQLLNSLTNGSSCVIHEMRLNGGKPVTKPKLAPVLRYYGEAAVIRAGVLAGRLNPQKVLVHKGHWAWVTPSNFPGMYQSVPNLLPRAKQMLAVALKERVGRLQRQKLEAALALNGALWVLATNSALKQRPPDRILCSLAINIAQCLVQLNWRKVADSFRRRLNVQSIPCYQGALQILEGM